MQWVRRAFLSAAVVALASVSGVATARRNADLAPLLQRHVNRILSTQASDQDACDAAFAKNPYASFLTSLPTTAGLRNCIASNVDALLVPLSAQGATCTLTSLISLLSSDSPSAAGLKAFSEFLNALISGFSTDASASASTPDLATVLSGWTTEATKNEAFCSVMNGQIGPCVESLVPVIVSILDKKGACCGQLGEFYELVKLIIPDGKTLDQTLVEIINGLHKSMCTTTNGTSAYCGQSLLSLLASIVKTNGDKSLLSPLVFGAGVPLFALPDGAAACSALESASFASRVSASGGAFEYADLSCCAAGYATLIQSFDDILKQLTGNTLTETLNIIAGLQDAPKSKQFASPYATLASCSFAKTKCTNPSFVLKEKPGMLATTTNSSKNVRPQNLKCTTTELCNADKVCTTVCKEGTAKIAPWADRAVSYQRNLSYAKPFCFTQLPATHNSGTTLARGWGNRDQLMNKVLDPNNTDSYMRTNNQFLTLTDQLNLGARFVEIDVHYYGRKIYDGHCSRISFSILDDISNAIKTSTGAALSAGAASAVTVEWQSSLMGCLPSLGGIRAEEARAHADTVKEIAAWLTAHPDDFVFVYLDVGSEITTFKKYNEMIALHTAAYSSMLLTPADLKKANGAWKTTALSDLVKLGKRVALVTGKDADGDAYFSMDMLCGGWADIPSGRTGGGAGTIWGQKTNTGTIVRAYMSSLHYATMSEEALGDETLVGTDTEPASFTAATLPLFMNAGVNILASDGLDGAVVESMVWSWAENEPSRGDTAVEISAKDGRWYGVKDKSSIKNMACVSSTSRSSWKIVAQGSSCPDGYAFGAPTLASENAALTAVLKAAGAETTAQLNVDMTTIPVISPEQEAAYKDAPASGNSNGNGNGSGSNGKGDSGSKYSSAHGLHAPAWTAIVLVLSVAFANVL